MRCQNPTERFWVKAAVSPARPVYAQAHGSVRSAGGLRQCVDVAQERPQPPGPGSCHQDDETSTIATLNRRSNRTLLEGHGGDGRIPTHPGDRIQIGHEGEERLSVTPNQPHRNGQKNRPTIVAAENHCDSGVPTRLFQSFIHKRLAVTGLYRNRSTKSPGPESEPDHIIKNGDCFTLKSFEVFEPVRVSTSYNRPRTPR